MENPYQHLPEKAFWAPAVGHRPYTELEQLWVPKFPIDSGTRIATFGSCFAQHIGRALRRRKYSWLNEEPAPRPFGPENKKRFNYEAFSARTGNIYTTSLLLQWAEWALTDKQAPDEVWHEGGRVYDPFRPTIEPDGFASVEEMIASRNQAIDSFRQAVTKANVLVFTLGLTESWFNAGGWEYPMCPGTAAGKFDVQQHQFANQTYGMVRGSLNEAMHLMRELNPRLKFLLTVSPVPLTASKSGSHVLVSTMYSKSTLRAVAGDLSENRRFVDYFPSYEIINSPASAGRFFEENKRTVSPQGVQFVMQNFFGSTQGESEQARRRKQGFKGKQSQGQLDAQCDEELLGAFGPEGRR